VAGLLGMAHGCSSRSDAPGIHVIVDERLAAPLQEELARFESDLVREGYTVEIESLPAASSMPPDIKAAIRARWQRTPSLSGVILVGGFAAPLFNKPARQGDPYWHDHLADFYYMDVDGVWRDTDGDGVLDRHAAFDGNAVLRALSWVSERALPILDRRKAEFWVSRIRADTLGQLGDEMSLYRGYFSRNHAYRSGEGPPLPPRAFLVAGSRQSISGWGARPQKLFEEVEISECTADGSTKVRQHLADPTGWTLGIIGSFSGPQVHKFHVAEQGGYDDTWFSSREGRALIAEYSLLEHAPWDLTSREVARLAPRVAFYHVLSSETGRHDVEGYLGGAYLFFGEGLVVIAGTQHSGAIGVPVFYEYLTEGGSLGDAWRRAIDWSLDNAGDSLVLKWCDSEEPWDPSADPYKAVLLGDGTLRLPVRSSVTR
jgi:hypothetical protein